MKQVKVRPVLGWRKWVALPDLGIAIIKAKVDAGACTLALNAVSMEEFVQDGEAMVRYEVLVRGSGQSREGRFFCRAPVIDSREVTNSGGHREHRIVIITRLQIGMAFEQVEITLTNRGSIKFPMLIGRSAIRRRYLVNPGRSYLAGKPGVGEPAG